MKFLHIADVHLGARPNTGKARSENQREREIWESLERIIKTCEKESIDLLLIAGDLFHRQPLQRELKEVNALFKSLSHTQVVLVAGNHDHIKRNSYYQKFSWSPNIHMILNEDLAVVELPELKTAVYGYSYWSKEREDQPFSQKKERGLQPIEILLLHGGDEKHVPFRKEELLQLQFDYVALGHIHKPQNLIPGKMAYAGALEPIDKNDTGAHGYVIGNINEKGCEYQFVPFASRQYIHLLLTLTKEMTSFEIKSRIREQIEKLGKQHIYKVILEGARNPQLLYDPRGMDVYGNIIELEDYSKEAYDYQKIRQRNQENLLGQLIKAYEGAAEDSLEYLAMSKGVKALLETRRGK